MAIALDNSAGTNLTVANPNNGTFAYTVTDNTNGLLLTSVASPNNSNAVIEMGSVTYAGTAMNLLGSIMVPNSSARNTLFWFSMFDPPTGENNIVIYPTTTTANKTIRISAASFTGVTGTTVDQSIMGTTAGTSVFGTINTTTSPSLVVSVGCGFDGFGNEITYNMASAGTSLDNGTVGGESYQKAGMYYSILSAPAQVIRKHYFSGALGADTNTLGVANFGGTVPLAVPSIATSRSLLGVGN